MHISKTRFRYHSPASRRATSLGKKQPSDRAIERPPRACLISCIWQAWPASKAQASRGLAAMAQEGLFDCVESAKPGPTFFVFDSQHPVWPKPQLPSTTTMRLCLIQA